MPIAHNGLLRRVRDAQNEYDHLKRVISENDDLIASTADLIRESRLLLSRVDRVLMWSADRDAAPISDAARPPRAVSPPANTTAPAPPPPHRAASLSPDPPRGTPPRAAGSALVRDRTN